MIDLRELDLELEKGATRNLGYNQSFYYYDVNASTESVYKVCLMVYYDSWSLDYVSYGYSVGLGKDVPTLSHVADVLAKIGYTPAKVYQRNRKVNYIVNL